MKRPFLFILILLLAVAGLAPASIAESGSTAEPSVEPAFSQSGRTSEGATLRVGELIFWCAALLFCLALAIAIRIKQS
ncbi:MAG: hypothetical protein Q4C04_06210 [Clostridia bacterium]|nr:hypothetical protein [Clostridia bacterium]